MFLRPKWCSEVLETSWLFLSIHWLMIFNRQSLFNMYCCPCVVCGVCVITKSVTGLYKGYCWRGGHWGWWARQRQHICCTMKTTRIMESWAVPNSGLNKHKKDFRCPPFFSLHPSKNISNPEQNSFCPSFIFFHDLSPPIRNTAGNNI